MEFVFSFLGNHVRLPHYHLVFSNTEFSPLVPGRRLNLNVHSSSLIYREMWVERRCGDLDYNVEMSNAVFGAVVGRIKNKAGTVI